MQPTLPLLDKIVVAADSELRTRLEPYDDHDDVLDSLNASLTDDQRTAREVATEEFVAPLRAGPAVKR